MSLSLVACIPDLFRIIADPGRLDAVFRISQRLSSTKELQPMLDSFVATEVGRETLADRYRLPALNFDKLQAHAEGTFGRAVADYFRNNHLDPKDIPKLEGATEHEFVQAHLYETHDLWHVVTGFETDVAGELGLQGFYAAQVPTKLAWILFAAGFINAVAKNFDDRAVRMDAVVRGWEMGKRAAAFPGQRWDRYYDLPLEDLRQQLGVTRNLAVTAPPKLAIAS